LGDIELETEDKLVMCPRFPFSVSINFGHSNVGVRVNWATIRDYSPALVDDLFDIGKIIDFLIVDYDRQRLGCLGYTTNNNGALFYFSLGGINKEYRVVTLSYDPYFFVFSSLNYLIEISRLIPSWSLNQKICLNLFQKLLIGLRIAFTPNDLSISIGCVYLQSCW
jgi:hypothetical protein